jgi:hypothetical protein
MDMNECSSVAIVFVKSALGEEESVLEQLKKLVPPEDAGNCEDCPLTDGAPICRGLKVRLLGTSTGHFDYVIAVEAEHMRQVHHLVLKCIRGRLGNKILDTESTFVYSLPSVTD